MDASRSLSCSLFLLALSSLAAGQDSDARGRELFLKNCASCHGATGDGKGTAELDRPARSFMDGGFSFGNTPEALFRTISVGIPGTPMAGFDASLSEEERRIVAAYVVTLGPPIEEVKEEDMILRVRDEPLVVRGKLPKLGEGLPEHPRGLLIGDPSGITFEYTVDDVRLLALRQGGFVKRTDWTGRGGTALEPLGKVAMLVEGGKPEATFSLAAGTRPLVARLNDTRIDGEHVFIGYHLLDGDMEVAHVMESPGLEVMNKGTGYSRLFRITATRPVHLALHDPTQLLGKDGQSFVDEHVDAVHCLTRAKDSREFHDLEFQAAKWTRRWGVLVVELNAGQHVDVLRTVLPIEAWDEELECFRKEVRDR